MKLITVESWCCEFKIMSRPRDILESFKYLLLLKSGRGEVDDIDHLGNRRVEPLAN